MSELPNAAPAEAQPAAQIVKPNSIPMIVYILFFVGIPFALAAIAGVILAYVNRSPSDDPVVASHYAYQIRTFWWGLVWIVLGFITSFVFIGYLILLVWLVWAIYRLIKGVSAWNRYEVIN